MRVLVRHTDLGTVAQLVRAVDDDAITGLEARQDLGGGSLDDAGANLRHGHRRVGIEHIGVGTLAAPQDAGAWRNDDVLAIVDVHHDIHELVGEQLGVGVRELCLQVDGSGAGVDLAVHRQQTAVIEQGGAAAIEGFHGRSGALAQTPQHRGQVVLRKGKHDGHGTHARHHRQCRAAIGLHDVARIHQAQADTAVDRRDNAAEVDVDLGRFHLCLIDTDQSFILLDNPLLVFGLLPRDRTLLDQIGVALQVHARFLERRLVLGKLAPRLRQCRLVGSRIDLDQEVALVHRLAFLERDFGDLAAYLGLDRHRRQGGDRTQGTARDIEFTLFHGGNCHREGTSAVPCPLAWMSASGLGRGRIGRIHRRAGMLAPPEHSCHQSRRRDEPAPPMFCRAGPGSG